MVGVSLFNELHGTEEALPPTTLAQLERACIKAGMLADAQAIILSVHTFARAQCESPARDLSSYDVAHALGRACLRTRRHKWRPSTCSAEGLV